jgi:hypothetical protein
MTEHGPAGTETAPDGRTTARCLCGSYWTCDMKAEVVLLRAKHIRDRAKDAKRLRGGLV